MRLRCTHVKTHGPTVLCDRTVMLKGEVVDLIAQLARQVKEAQLGISPVGVVGVSLCEDIVVSDEWFLAKVWLGLCVWLGCRWKCGNCYGSKFGLHSVNEEHDWVAQSVRNGESDEVRQCEVSVARSVAAATVTDSPVKSLPGCYHSALAYAFRIAEWNKVYVGLNGLRERPVKIIIYALVAGNKASGEYCSKLLNSLYVRERIVKPDEHYSFLKRYGYNGIRPQPSIKNIRAPSLGT